jgi:hypothetical protein
VLLVSTPAGAVEPNPAAVREHEAKAELIARIPSFVSWPDVATERRLRVVAVGRGAFQRVLADTLHGRTVGDRRFAVRIGARPALDDAPDILIVDDPTSSSAKAAIEAIAGRPVLIIGNGRDATLHGCFVGIYLEKSRLRFVAAPDAAREVGIVFRANFLKLARIVEPSREGGQR